MHRTTLTVDSESRPSSMHQTCVCVAPPFCFLCCMIFFPSGVALQGCCLLQRGGETGEKLLQNSVLHAGFCYTAQKLQLQSTVLGCFSRAAPMCALSRCSISELNISISKGVGLLALAHLCIPTSLPPTPPPYSSVHQLTCSFESEHELILNVAVLKVRAAFSVS